ncbi:DNA cytosine methyltransferase [Glacieibacterium megasporae]|uniref:DNA cytosine methyltransferase n=1 Tax=Glacieibacterium megasporae TaxID=2835787 RepID=UPI001C1DFEE4|nr:DNA cytosine methyltransferase [Polymorphobacter megasporae]UAJ11069.1 DNA cytosine methyltransferase [Polymorphobacter megasporae]
MVRDGFPRSTGDLSPQSAVATLSRAQCFIPYDPDPSAKDLARPPEHRFKKPQPYMMTRKAVFVTIKRPRAVDLYSGVGGWSLGLRLAGIEVVSSYERWGPANETNFKNNSHQAQTVDIRRLALEDLPSDIDIVVGSPPCTQFSFSNRGGGGDIADGLEDVIRFLRIVDHLRPRVWAMENVPRVAKIIEAELKPGGVLEDFLHLGCITHIIDMAEYGLPQRRRRCLAGNFDVALFASYRRGATNRTLGDVVTALAADPVVDPLFGLRIAGTDLTDHIKEEVLTSEEVRINRAGKVTHTVYNAMPFPDQLDRPVRTITATCTRVSRESIVIPTDGSGTVRRLTLRERASLQGFPITFEFYGANYGQKLRMIGNAVPPAITYLVGHALQGHIAAEVPSLPAAAAGLRRPGPISIVTPPDRIGGRYPATRNFKFAIPSLQLKSGVRFELGNLLDDDIVGWRVAFYFGTSKSIQSLKLDGSLDGELTARMSDAMRDIVSARLDDLSRFIRSADIGNMQALWAHRGPGGTRAFMLLDKLDEIGAALTAGLSAHVGEASVLIDAALRSQHGEEAERLPGVPKLQRNAALILAGLLVGSKVNPLLGDHSGRSGRQGMKLTATRV